MSERKHWKAEEKFALINEIKDKGQVVDMQEIRSRSNHVLPLEGILRDLRH